LVRGVLGCKNVLKYLFLGLAGLAVSGFFTPLLALDPNKPINRYLLDEWDMGKGLSSETVEAIVQAPDGYLWLGTGEGLFRYDGINFEHIYFEGAEHQGDPHITALVNDKEGGLWIGAKGLFHYNHGDLRSYAAEDGFPGNEIKCLTVDSFGSLWIGTNYNYLVHFKEGKFTHFDQASGLEDIEIYSILEDSSGHLWVANASGGLFLGQNGKFVKHEISGLSGEYSVYALYQDRKGILWVGTNVGLVGIANAGTIGEAALYLFSPAKGLSDNNVWSILEDSHGNLWVGSQDGINRLSGDPGGKIVIETRLEGSIVKCLVEDREENLWIGTIGTNLKRLRDGTFFTYWKNAGVPYWRLSLHQDHKGVIRIGSGVGDLYRFDPGSERFHRVLQTHNNVESEIYAIEEDAKGDLWLGTVRKGIVRLEADGRKTTVYTTENGLSSNSIRVIFRDSRERIWIGTIGGGVNCYHNGGFEQFTARAGLAGDLVFVICEDSTNNIWIGTSTGITVLAGGELQSPHLKTYLPGEFIIDILEDSTNPGTYWIGTNDKGLKRFKGGKFFSYTEEQGLAANSIYKILEDSRGHLWIGSADGIFRVGKANLNALAAGKINRLECTSFGFSDGLKSLECRLGARNSAIKTAAGELWFGTRRGIAVVNPERVTVNKYPPPVVLKEVLINYEAIPPDQPGRSFKDVKDVLFSFTAPTFVAPDRVKMRYRLEGHEAEWTEVRHPVQRTVRYKNLPPGQYHFQVIACNSSGVWNKKGASFRFTITPYFYQTLPFKMAVLLLVLAVMAALYYGVRRYWYFRKLKQKYKYSTLDPQKAEHCMKKLLYLLETKKLYQDESLSLSSLAKKLSIAPRYLSQIINEQLNKNFRDFLNHYRIEEAKDRLLSQGKDNGGGILEIAYEVGFNSKEVFNRCFKKYTGMTPSEFKKEKKNSAAQ
jgi:ligand-binding sensor domain-containing protein/AraC-like DNA-binding protein